MNLINRVSDINYLIANETSINNDIFYPIDVISVPKAFGIIGDPLFMFPGFPIPPCYFVGQASWE